MGLSTDVLDTAHGVPAAGMCVALDVRRKGETALLKSFTLNADGRNPDGLLINNALLEIGNYRLVFGVAAYFRTRGVALSDPPFLMKW